MEVDDGLASPDSTLLASSWQKNLKKEVNIQRRALNVQETRRTIPEDHLEKILESFPEKVQTVKNDCGHTKYWLSR